MTKIKVKSLTELTKDDMYGLSLLGVEIEVEWINGKVYRVEWI